MLKLQSVPIDMNSTRVVRSSTNANRAESNPNTTTANTGTCVFELTSAKARKKRPSAAIAYAALGRVNIDPINDVDRPTSAPTAMT